MRPKDFDKKDAILRAATKAFAEEGYYQTKVSRIAELAGVADGTIYRYFENKESILITLYSWALGQAIESYQRRLNDCSDSKERIAALVDQYLINITLDYDLTFVLVYEARQPYREMREKIIVPTREYFALIEKVISQGIEAGEIIDIDVRMARRMFTGLLENVALDWLFNHKKTNIKQFREQIVRLICRALLK